MTPRTPASHNGSISFALPGTRPPAGSAGQLGNGTYLVANSATPVAVQGAVRFTSLTSIDNTTCGVSRDADKRVYCWGANPGLAGFAPASVPAGTSLTGAERVFGPGLFMR